MNSFVAARVKKEGAMCANKIPARSFPGSDMAERKRNSTGREVLPGKNPCGWLGSAGGGDGRFDTAASNPAPRAQGEATKPGGCDCRAKTSLIHDFYFLLLPPIRILYVAEVGLLSATFNRGTVD